MGPLGVACASPELFLNGETEDFNPDLFVGQLQKAVMLVGHAVQITSWYRRLHSLGNGYEEGEEYTKSLERRGVYKNPSRGRQMCLFFKTSTTS